MGFKIFASHPNYYLLKYVCNHDLYFWYETILSTMFQRKAFFELFHITTLYEWESNGYETKLFDLNEMELSPFSL